VGGGVRGHRSPGKTAAVVRWRRGAGAGAARRGGGGGAARGRRGGGRGAVIAGYYGYAEIFKYYDAYYLTQSRNPPH
jgi:hypothetical protein